MKLGIKTIACIITVALILFGFTACIDGDKAKQTIEEFLSAVETENYEAAKSYLHPDRPADLKQYFENTENRESVDFQSGIEFLSYSSVKSAHYDSTVGGSIYETTFEARIGNQTATFTIEIVENDMGYGIYNFTVDF